MPVTLEVLDRDRWEQLESIPGDVVPIPPRECSVAVLARNEAREIVGRLYLIFPPTVIGPWVREDFRSRTVLTMLFDKLQDVMRKAQMRQLLASVKPGTEFVEYARKLGFEPVEWQQWIKRVD